MGNNRQVITLLNDFITLLILFGNFGRFSLFKTEFLLPEQSDASVYSICIIEGAYVHFQFGQEFLTNVFFRRNISWFSQKPFVATCGYTQLSLPIRVQQLPSVRGLLIPYMWLYIFWLSGV